MFSTTHPIDKASHVVGGRAQLALALHVTPAAIGNWKTRGVPIEHCAAIERLTRGEVRRIDLRPTDWAHIWPELVGSEGAPDPKLAAQQLKEAA